MSTPSNPQTNTQTDSRFDHNAIDEEIKKAVESFGEPPRIMLTGKTGAGKSSLINALVRRELQKTDVVPCTRDQASIDWDAGDANMKLVDMPGFAEPGRHDEYMYLMLENLPNAHIGLLVVGAPDRALEHERLFLEKVRQQDPQFPFLVVGNKIDLLPPSRDWQPKDLHLDEPLREDASKKERNIRAWADEVVRVTKIPEQRFAAVSSGERFDDLDNQYGITLLTHQIVEALPEAARNHAARVFHVEALRKKRAETVIYAASVAAGAAALIPVPIADALMITPIQVGMITTVALIYGFKLDVKQAIGFLGPALAALAGPLAVQQLAKLLPGFGHAISAGVAAAMTWAVGMSYLHFFIHGNFQPSADEVRAVLQEQWREAQKIKSKLEEDAKKRAQERTQDKK